MQIYKKLPKGKLPKGNSYVLLTRNPIVIKGCRQVRLSFLAVCLTSEFRHLLFKLFGRDSKLAVEHLNPEAKRDIRSCGVAVADFNNDGWLDILIADYSDNDGWTSPEQV